jgi:hypothetical protein
MTIMTDGVSKDPYGNKEILEGRLTYAVDGESTDTYVITLSTAPTEYVDGMSIYFKANTANTGACSLNVNGLGAKAIKKLHDQDPGNNHIEAGSIVHVIYDATDGTFQLMTPAAN